MATGQGAACPLDLSPWAEYAQAVRFSRAGVTCLRTRSFPPFGERFGLQFFAHPIGNANRSRARAVALLFIESNFSPIVRRNFSPARNRAWSNEVFELSA